MKLFKRNKSEQEVRDDQGGEGRRNAEATPKVGEDAVRGQTSHPAPADDVGVPPEDALRREEQEARKGAGEDEETHVERSQG